MTHPFSFSFSGDTEDDEDHAARATGMLDLERKQPALLEPRLHNLEEMVSIPHHPLPRFALTLSTVACPASVSNCLYHSSNPLRKWRIPIDMPPKTRSLRHPCSSDG